ncbi:MAG: hypothetical protein DHS20C13_23290 [Thermodesulfobacteriota bacterium]|nr:MAG: hypothetical protein DHS20C13_23290 [Thermodesulfobacteriota bacterium]
MDSQQFADLELKTIISLAGMPVQKDLVNPRKPLEMAKKVRVTFRPLPRNYGNQIVIKFREKLKNKLEEHGVNVIPWDEAAEVSDGWISKVLKTRKVKRNIHAVVDVKRDYSLTRTFLSGIAERMYGYLRKPDMSVMEILRVSGWADDFTARYVQDPFNTQILTLMPLEPEFANQSTTYDRKIAIGIQNLIATMSEIIMGIAPDKFSLVNMNLSDSIYLNDGMDDFVLNSLIPKIYAPIKPPVLNRFKKGEYDPEESAFPQQLAELGRLIKSTNLYPRGSKFSEKVKRQSHKDVVEKIMEGRTGVSYGFIALAEAPVYEGKATITKSTWDKLKKVESVDDDMVRENKKGRWFVRTVIRGKEIYQQVPDMWITTSRSGSDKTNLDPSCDIVRIGVVKGKLHLETPRGVDLNRKDIRPSFDTYVILAQALASALYTPDLIKNGLPILHFHGYPDPNWFRKGEYHSGANNPSLPCGTVEAALLNYSAIYELANNNGKGMKMLCLVESDHGVNIMGLDKDHIIKRLTDGVDKGHVKLGGTYLPDLKKFSKKQAAEKLEQEADSAT